MSSGMRERMVGDVPAHEDPSGRDLALRRLPGVYSLALRLRAAGLADELIAECLTVEPEAIAPLLEIAAAKLAAALAQECD